MNRINIKRDVIPVAGIKDAERGGKTKTELRKFGLTMAIALVILGSVLLWARKPAWLYLDGLALLFLMSGLMAPRILRPAEWLWMKLAHFLGLIMTRVILVLTYYLAITPMGLLLRLLGKDQLCLKDGKGDKSFWIPVDPDGPTSRPDKPY